MTLFCLVVQSKSTVLFLFIRSLVTDGQSVRQTDTDRQTDRQTGKILNLAMTLHGP